MRFNYSILPLLLMPFCAFSQETNSESMVMFSKIETNENTVVKSYSNNTDKSNSFVLNSRTVDFPTQIIRMQGKIEDRELSCAQVNDEIEKALLNHFTRDKFTYHTVVFCTYDPETKFAKRFRINSYFDPLTDEAVSYLKTYLDEYNGSDLLGSRLEIESAKGLVVAISLSAGMKKKTSIPTLLQYRNDRSNFYFKNNYEMRNALLSDIYANFYSDDPDKILPFIDKWLFPHASDLYRTVLKDSNYAEIQPEQVFLMKSGDTIFVSDLKFYFAHNCTQNERHHCL